jgi:hypothetical protein
MLRTWTHQRTAQVSDMSVFDNERDDAVRQDRGLPDGNPAPASSGRSPYEVLLGALEEVIREWRSLVMKEPWAQLSPSRLLDSFPEILPRMLRLARASITHIDDPLREIIATAHGHFRRVDGVPLASVTEEWAYLKRACRIVLDTHGIDNGDADRAMERLDILVDDAVGYTLRGYYQPELDSLRGRGLERRERPDRRSGIHDRRERGED